MTGTSSATLTNYYTSDQWTTYYPYQTNVGTGIIVNTPQITIPEISMPQANTEYQSPSGVRGKIGLQPTEKGIHPKLYFSYVKSKLNKLEREKLARRVNKLRRMVVSADDMDQQALYESLSLMLAVAIRESEAYVCGYTKWIHKDSINKFIALVRGKTVKFEELEKFPRIIPNDVRNKIKSCKNKSLFDDYWILYTDYTKEVVKTTKEKVREKDPIVFGRFSYQEDILYPIGDWVDEYCDITIDKVVEKLRYYDTDYKLNIIPDLDDKSIKKLLEEVRVRHDRLKNTNRDNYKQNMEQEEIDRKARKEAKKNDVFDWFRKKLKEWKR